MRSDDERTFRDILIDAYYDSIPLISINVIWFLLTLPVVTAIPSIAGLSYATNKLAHKESAGVGTFFEGFKIYFWTSWKWGLTIFLGYFLIWFNIQFYGSFGENWAEMVKSVFYGFGTIWFVVTLFSFPLLLEQEDRRVITALRNSIIIASVRPWHTIKVVIIVLVLSLLSTLYMLPLWVVITGSLIAYFSNIEVILGIQAAREKQSN
jgi:uncharacterized membrane protein YesL